MMKSSLIFLLISIALAYEVGVCHGGELRKDFYKDTCPQAEDIVRSIIWQNVANNATLPAKFLRMHFHDCFVRGCDASILLDSTPNNTAEKAAIPNLSLGVLGFDVIDEFKFPIWEVLTGRRDGLISRASEALSNIPSPFFNFTLLKQSFANKSLTVHDLVVLSGGHTIGVGHCNLFSNRLYNFTGKGDEDPSLNSTYASFLKTQCRSLADNTTTVPMDPLTPLSFDNNYFKILVLNEGLFQSDAALLTDKDSSNIVDELLDPDNFFNEFAQSIMRMGSIGVLTGSAGEIRKNYAILIILSLLVFGAVTVCSADGLRATSGLRQNFYRTSCPQAELLASRITRNRAQSNSALSAKLLRMHFHDCFVRGCDASILLDSVGDTQTEKDTIPNQSLSGYDVIDEIKTELEKVCPGVVSCADILALAARDAVSFQFNRPLWVVLTGRRDGNVSLASDIDANIPSPFSDFNTLLQLFSNKGLDVHDLVVLSGGHTIGVAHCATFSKRLYNFNGTDGSDPSLDPKYAEFLKTQCPNPFDPATTVEMDPQSLLKFDTSYFNILLQNKGLFQSDAALLQNEQSARIVRQLTIPNAFFAKFAIAMKKMGAIEVLTGDAGQIRKNCHVVNP
ncbi:hypothetical protein GH714_002491 [Hevea brasiliensis]|uniref:peroxidase n=1 Tax=Hevea brasiliensis TaxID=3981 RepID=A0A6A6KI33_HEVBR|nr:hypothetical protein GH714_002491 [Hevea brasiliensis]